MTLVIAVKANAGCLNPKKKPLSVDPGLVFAVDTRFSYRNSMRIHDNALKWWQLGEHTLAAYAGDVSFAEKVLGCTVAACLHNSKVNDDNYTQLALQKIARLVAPKRTIEHTTFVYGSRALDGDFHLYSMNSAENFEIRNRDATIVAVGSGARFVTPLLDHEIDFWSEGLTAPARSGYIAEVRDGALTIRQRTAEDLDKGTILDAVGLLSGLVDTAILKSGISSVGGSVMPISITDAGVTQHCGHVRSNDAPWRPITKNQNYLTYCQMRAAAFTYYGPLLDGDGNLIPNTELTVRPTEP